MGIGPVGFDYSPLEQVLGEFGGAVTVPHRHDYYELIWFTEGKGRHFVDFAAHDIVPGTLLFLGRHQIHAFENISGFKGHILRFAEKFLSTCLANEPSSLTHSLFGSEASPLRTLTPEVENVLNPLTTLIACEVAKPTQLLHEKMLAHLLGALLIEAERMEPVEAQLSIERRRIMQQFHRFVVRLEDRFSKEHRVEQYAELLAVSTKRLNEICQQAAGSSAKKIIAERIMLEARRYLLHSELDVQQVCYRLGFEDPAYFSRAFKKASGYSPSEFRRQAEKSK
jgi:AraC-like DNA-binding protein